jgi:hypothetical protein
MPQYLYHEKEHLGKGTSGGSFAGMIIRKALMEAKNQWKDGEDEADIDDEVVFTTQNGCGPFREDLLSDHPFLAKKQDEYLVKTRKGYTQFEIKRACHEGDERRSWWQKLGDQWPIFVRAGHREDREDGDVTLNPIIIRFARRFAAKILAQPPLHTREDVEAWCSEKGYIKGPLNHGPSSGVYSYILRELY